MVDAEHVVQLAVASEIFLYSNTTPLTSGRRYAFHLDRFLVPEEIINIWIHLSSDK